MKRKCKTEGRSREQEQGRGRERQIDERVEIKGEMAVRKSKTEGVREEVMKEKARREEG